jgi:hypothetical protein
MTPKSFKTSVPCQVWRHKPVLLGLGRLRQEDGEFRASLGYKGRNNNKNHECHSVERQKLQLCTLGMSSLLPSPREKEGW